MILVLTTLAVAFAALCVWLGVRIVNRRERWAKWTLAGVIAVPALYVGSFGPACWLASHAEGEIPMLATVYQPLLRVMAHDRTQSIRDSQVTNKHQSGFSGLLLGRGLLAWYSRVGANQRFCWRYNVNHDQPAGKPAMILTEDWTWRPMDE